MPEAEARIVELAGLSLFGGCLEDDLALVAQAIGATRRLGEGEVLCREGEVADRWWIIAEGQADVTVAGIYTSSVGAGDSVGEVALLDGEPRSATVTASTPMVVHEVDGDRFLGSLEASPRLAVGVLRQLAKRLRASNRPPNRPPIRPPAPAIPARPTPAVTPARPTPALQFDPATPGYYDDPAAHLAPLRESAPVHWSDAVESWVVTRYDDVRRLTRDHALLGSVSTLERPGVEPRIRGRKMMIRKDGPDHLRLRRVVSKAFTPRAVSEWQDRSEAIVARLLGAAADKGRMDAVADFALVVPSQIISEMLGMPDEDGPQLQAWSSALSKRLDPIPDPVEEQAAEQANKEMTAYVEAAIAERRARPSPDGPRDLLDALIRAEDQGDVLDDGEIVAQVFLLYIAGHETTRNLIGNGLVHLFAAPGQLDRLRTDPELDANTIEEVLRIESPAQLTRRVTYAPLEVGGVTIPAESHVTLLLASANRDPRKWGRTADDLDIGRPGANEHVSFGGGSHFCLGNSLARLEARIALPALVRRFPRMAPAYERPQWSPRVVLRGVDRLPVTLR